MQLCLLRIYLLSKSHLLVSSSTEFVFYRTSIPVLSCFLLICIVLEQKIPTQYYTCLSLCQQMSKKRAFCDTRVVVESKVVLIYLYSLDYRYQGSTSKLFPEGFFIILNSGLFGFYKIAPYEMIGTM